MQIKGKETITMYHEIEVEPADLIKQLLSYYGAAGLIGCAGVSGTQYQEILSNNSTVDTGKYCLITYKDISYDGSPQFVECESKLISEDFARGLLGLKNLYEYEIKRGDINE